MTHQLHIRNFGRFEERHHLPNGLSADIELPQHGLLCVSCNNGSGKTLLFSSAITWVLWGASGIKPDPIGQRVGSVRYVGPNLTVERQRRTPKGSLELVWNETDKPAEPYDTPTKAQAGLETHLRCDADRWLQTSLLHADTASAQFTKARDSARKAQIEALVPGFAAFEPALTKLRRQLLPTATKALRAAEQAMTDAERDRQNQEQTLRQVALQLEALQPAQPTDQLDRRRQELLGLAAQQRQRLQELRAERDRMLAVAPDLLRREDEHRARSDLREADRRSADLKRIGPTCETCGQAVAESYRSNLSTIIETLRHGATMLMTELESVRTEARAARQRQLDRLAEQIQTVDGKVVRLEETAGELATQISASAAVAGQRERLAQLRSTAETRLAELVEQWGARNEALLAAQQRLADLEAAEQVLDLRGLRAHLTRRVLGALETLANAELASLWPGVELRISATEENKSGTISETIGLRLVGSREAEVEELNRGALRRIDLALFLARRELARATGPLVGYVVLDEILDSLDPAGVAGAAERLAVLARRELVIVISHSPSVWKGLPFDQHWTIEDGQPVRK